MQDAPDAGRAGGHHIGVEHHESLSAIAVQWMVVGELNDPPPLHVGEPVVAWQPGIVFVDFAVAGAPVLVLTAGDAEPGDETRDGDVGFVGPGADEIDDGVARVVGDPALGQGSPRLFLARCELP